MNGFKPKTPKQMKEQLDFLDLYEIRHYIETLEKTIRQNKPKWRTNDNKTRS